MAGEEQAKVVPPEAPKESVQTTSEKALAVVTDYIETKKKAALVASNVTPANEEKPKLVLPRLTEVIRTGYVRNVKSQITCCIVDGFYLEKNTAYDYILMRNAAAKEKLLLPLVAAYRTNEFQATLYAQRVNPDGSLTQLGKELGRAARPGFSNHQSGTALDIGVGMTIDDYVNGRNSVAFLWMKDHAHKYGFSHTEGSKVDEPWHWTHDKKEIVGLVAYKELVGYDVLTVEAANAAAQADQTGTSRSKFLEINDETAGLARALQASKTKRSTFLASSAVTNANKSAAASLFVSGANLTTIEVSPQTFAPDSVKALSYDFSTGLWGDGKEV